MEVSTASVSSTTPLPRLRVTRNNQDFSPSRSQASGDQEQIPPFQFKNTPSYPDSQTSEDEFKIEFGTRLLSASLPSFDSSAPTSDTTRRLKALMERLDNSSRTSVATNKTNLPPSPSESDSEVNLRPAQATRTSIRSLFQDALREPGDTPQRSRIKRRASFNVSDSPKADKSRRKSTSDDDPEIIKYKDEPSASSALPLDRLRRQFTQLVYPSDAQSTSSRRSETTDSTPKRPFNSRSSKVPVHHSPITHTKSHKNLEPFESLKDDDSEINMRHRTPAGHTLNTNIPTETSNLASEGERSFSLQNDPDIDAMRFQNRISPSHLSFRTSSDHSERKASERVKPGSWPAPPPPGSGPRSVGPSRQSLTNGKLDDDRLSLDGRSSRSDSMIQNAESNERLSEARNEQHELERKRPSSRHSFLKNDASGKKHSYLHVDHASSSKVHINGHSHSQTHLNDRHRAYEHDTLARAVSHTLTTSSSEEEEKEDQYERERNWNSPQAKWKHQHSHSGHVEFGSSRFSSNSKLKGKEVDHGQTDFHSLSSVDRAPRGTLHPQQSSDALLRHSRGMSPVPIAFTSPRAQKLVPPSSSSNDEVSPIALRASSTRDTYSRTPRAPSHSESSSMKISKGEDNTTLAVNPIKRHRRTTTELSEPMGAYPKQIGVTSVLAPNDSDGSLFGNESFPPPRMSTPPLKNSEISELTISPVPSDIPLPPSPPSAPNPSHDPVTRADADLARLQKVIAPNSPQQSSSIFWSQNPDHEDSRNFEIMQPPRSKKSSSINTLGSATSFSPPRDKEGWQTPSNRTSDELPAKTPHPPGAFRTPAHLADEMKRPDELRRTPINRADNVEISLPGVTALSQTPAPPGAYISTPATSKLRGILKVRFDRDHKDIQDIQANNVPDLQEANMISTPPSPSSGEVPLDLSPSRRHKLRIVDEYGRARKFTENGEEIVLDRKTSQHASGVDETTLTPRRRAKMRQVDAFGKEIIANQLETKEGLKIDEATEKETKPQRKKQALSHIAKSLGELQQEMVQEENALSATFSSDGIPDKRRLVGLATVSKAARTEREKLSQQLQRERDAEGVLANKLFVARNLQRLPMPQANERPWWVRKWRLAIIIIFLEVVLLFMGYKLALVHAKHIWLQTYFDPFFPALYLHPSLPSFLSSHPESQWSVFATSRDISSFSVSRFIMGLGRSVWNWRPDPWEGWGSSAAAPMVPQAWPS